MTTIETGGFRSHAFRSASALLLSLCASTGAFAQEAAPAAAPSAEAASATPTATARVRLFGQNGIMVHFYQNSSCVGGKGPKTTVSGGVGDAFGSFLGRAKNTSIGMPETPTTADLGKRDGYFSKAYFREYEIPGNQPMALRMAFQSAAGAPGSKYCRAFGGTFMPEAGKQYEVTLEVAPNECLAVVREIQQTASGPANLRDIPVAAARDCD
jgi:hypothetical protein